MNRLLCIPVRRNNYSAGRVTSLAEFTTVDSWDKCRLKQSFFNTQQVSLYRPSSEIYAQENIFVVSFHHSSTLVSN